MALPALGQQGRYNSGGVGWISVATEAELRVTAVFPVGGVKRALKGAAGSGRWMAAPALLAVLAVVVYPLTFSTYYGFRKVLPGVEGEFVGFANYAGLARDPDFVEALSTTALFTAASAGLSCLAGLGLALLLAKPFPGREAVAVAVFLPWVFPAVVVATFGRLALFDGVGFLNNAAEAFGLADAGSLLLEKSALLSVAVLTDVWRGAPFVALLILAGMRTIPKDVYEAASVDGATPLQGFLRITLPLLKPTLLVVLLIRLLDAFRVFDLFRVLGNGDLKSLSTYVYQNVLLSQLNFGLGSAAAVFVFACALSAALFFVLVLRAQAPTGLAQAALHGDAAQQDAGGRGRFGPRLGAVGGFWRSHSWRRWRGFSG